MRHVAITLLTTLSCLTGCASLYVLRPALPIGDVVTMSQQGPAETVIDRIGASRTTYALRGSDFGKLKARGVSDPALDYMQQSLVSSVDMLTRYWVLGDDMGGCASCYPQPVDVDALKSGYGVAGTAPAGRYQAGKPPGTPPWVPFPPGRITGTLTLGEIQTLAQAGTPAAQILDRIASSRISGVSHVAAAGAVTTQPITTVSGSQLARMREGGVGDQVLDAVQGRYLAQLIEAARMRYQNWGKGPGSMQ
jgi:hypothetical protein